MNRVYGAALLGMVAGVLVASAAGGLARRRPHTVLGALAGAVIAGGGEAVYLIVLALWPLLLAIGVLVLAGMTAMAVNTFTGGRAPWHAEIPDDWEGPEG